MYELTIEPNTPFGKMNLQMPDNETMAQMYLAIGDTLQLPRYEVSNHATPGNECVHNQNVWDGQPYLGIGRGAAGRILMDGVWYEQLGNNAQFEKMDDNARAIEMILTGMRTLRGCRLTDTIKNVIDMDWVRKNQSLVQINGDRISATPQGMLILDDLMVKLVK
jgi:oxygen-independent coproporphyrinogen-3 oxidase